MSQLSRAGAKMFFSSPQTSLNFQQIGLACGQLVE
jgi:hypothetical protein